MFQVAEINKKIKNIIISLKDVKTYPVSQDCILR
jgi:hypothetical protein